MLKKPAFLFVLLAAACIAAVCAITSESFWIDELMSAYLITSDSTAEYQARLSTLNTSDIQMPFYMKYAYGWEKISGDSELALRMSNLPWFLLGVYGFWRFLRSTPKLRFLAILILIVSPFSWFYLNELRPYAMQLGSSCVVLGCGMRMILGWQKNAALNAGDLWLTAFGIAAMAGCTMLSVPWIGAFGLLFFYAAMKGGIRFPKAHLIASGIVTGLVLAGLAVYYASTLTQGARAASYAGNPLLGFAFSAYELFGFAGLGPGRTDLRQIGLNIFTPLQLALIASLALVLLILGIRFLKSLPQVEHLRQKGIAWGLLIGPPMLFMLVLAFAKDFRVLGRHLTPLLPVVALFLGCALTAMRGKFHCALVTALCALLLFSSLALRFAERHRKDDYRQAANIVKTETAAGNNVLWVANLAAIPYYNLADTGMRSMGQGATIVLFGKADPTITRPSKVLVSKPDIHDPAGFSPAFIQQGNYREESQFPGFTLWTR